MSEEDIDKIGLYSWKVDHNISRAAYNSLPDHANNIPFISLKEAQSLIDNYSDTLCDYYDMCKHSCLCFAGPYAKDQKCSKCGADRFDRNGKPFQRFLYIKIIPRLQKMYNHPSTKERLMYRDKSTREYDNSNIQDIFDGSMYRILLEKEIEVDGRKLGTKYFADDRDIALSFSSDGFCPFDNGSGTCWPLVLFNLNLPPEERVHTREILSVGLIPGPKKPEDFDSFIYPLVEELLQLTVGVHTWDADLGSFFTLRAHLLYVSGDTPAVSMIMHMKGTGSFHPCRMCNATSVRHSQNCNPNQLYLPLQSSATDPTVPDHDPYNLPCRTHYQFIRQAREVAAASSAAEKERLGQKHGIKGLSILEKLPTIDFPLSFPVDAMHNLFENILKLQVNLFSGAVKDLADEDFVLTTRQWAAVGEATAAAGATIPSSFAARPPDFVKNRQACTADTWSFWLQYIAPVLLDGLLESRFYKHFMRFSSLVRECLAYEMPRERLAGLKTDWIKWGVDFYR